MLPPTPAEARLPRDKHTHRITIPGTTFIAHVNGEEAALKLAKRLAKTSTGMVGRRKVKAQPVIDELAALPTP